MKNVVRTNVMLPFSQTLGSAFAGQNALAYLGGLDNVGVKKCLLGLLRIVMESSEEGAFMRNEEE